LVAVQGRGDTLLTEQLAMLVEGGGGTPVVAVLLGIALVDERRPGT
jgi:hypothetical protein